MKIKLILFDIFGTVFDLSSRPKDEIRAYVDHVKKEVWQPLYLPTEWYELPAHPDAAEGIRRLRKRFVVCTLSNGPVDLQVALSRHAGIDWDWIVPLQMCEVYKPASRAYRVPSGLLNCYTNECLLVTANPTFGDVEGAARCWMRSQVIRQPGCPQTIIELAELLEAEA